MLFQNLLQVLTSVLHKSLYRLAKKKRLETDVSSLKSSVFMRIFVAAFTFGDRCSTN